MIVIPSINAAEAQARAALGSGGVPPCSDPLSAAREFSRCGFQRLHFDSGGETLPWWDHAPVLREILFDPQVEVQVHGGLTDTDHIRDLLSAGARFAVIGCRGVSDPDWLSDLATLFSGDIMLNVEISFRRVRTSPWMGRTPDVFDFLDDVHTSELAGMIVTDLTRRRGTQGPDLALLEDLAESCDCPVYAAGGILTMEHLRSLADRSVGGAVVGRAFAAGMLNPFAVAEEFAA